MSHDALVAVARAVFEAAGGTPIDPDYVLPAEIPLELSGEAVRARLCVFTDNRGTEMAMRPDLTLPVAQREAARLEAGPSAKTYTYAARAFRLPAAQDDPFEFTQVGVERFGYAADPSADAELFALVHRAVEACGVSPKAIVTGDLAIFPACIDALDLPAVTTDLLKRAFRQEGGVRAVLDAASRPLEADILAALEAPDTEAALSAVLAAVVSQVTEGQWHLAESRIKREESRRNEQIGSSDEQLVEGLCHGEICLRGRCWGRYTQVAV